MRRGILIALGSVLALTPELTAQSTPTKTAPKPATPGRARSIAKQLADTTVTSAAGIVADTLLGEHAGMVAAIIGAGGQPTCAPGLMAMPAQYAGMPGAGAAQGMTSMPSAGSAIVGLAKKKLAGKAAGAAAGAAAGTAAGAAAGAAAQQGAAPQYLCGTPDQITAAMQAAQSAGAAGQAAGAGASMKSGMGAALAATPQGALVGGAVAAAPMAMAGAKKLGGMFGRGAQTAESMKKDLAKGKLTVKNIKFVRGSDELAPGFEADLAVLAEALQGLEGQFVLSVPAEAGESAEPDAELAERRMQRVFAHLLLSGLPNGRVMTGSGGKAVKVGDARVQLTQAAERAP
jgi:hypothetical protein